MVFTKNVTEAINLVAYSWGRANLGPGDVVVLTEMEHHANLVPWLMLKAERGIELRYLPLTDDGQLDLSDLDPTLDGAKLLGVSAVSNVLGTINPIAELAQAAHAAGALILVDGAQQAPHLPTDVRVAWRRLLRLHRPQDARPDRDRRPVGPRRSCSKPCRHSSAAAR